jgi:hypothetical protein
MRNQARHGEYQVIQTRILPCFPVNNGLKMKFCRVWDETACNEDRSHRRVRVKALGVGPLRYVACKGRISLPFARRDIIACGVCGDIIQRF